MIPKSSFVQPNLPLIFLFALLIWHCQSFGHCAHKFFAMCFAVGKRFFFIQLCCLIFLGFPQLKSFKSKTNWLLGNINTIKRHCKGSYQFPGLTKEISSTYWMNLEVLPHVVFFKSQPSKVIQKCLGSFLSSRETFSVEI